MATIDQVLKNIGDGMRGLTKDVTTLKAQVARLLAQDGGGHYMPFSNYGAFGASITVSQGVYLAGIPKQIVVQSWKQVWHQQSPLDGANYWNISFNTLAGGHYSFNTFGNGAANTWNRYDVVNAGFVAPEAYRYVYIAANKVGAPGALFLGTPMVYFV